jgi:hypothetical protein
MSRNAADAEVFVYTGEGGDAVPDDVARVRVDSSVMWIPARAFCGRNKLAEVELSEGLVEIGNGSFKWCEHSITKINIPNSLRRIRDGAFASSLRTPICLHDGIESIGARAFAHCIFTNFRVPPLITVIQGILSNCKSTFSLELPNISSEIKNYSFSHCYCLRNVAFPPNAVIDNNIFGVGSMIERSDLRLLFGSEAAIVRELMHRFDELPIHQLVYYQSYHQGVLQNLIAAIYMRSDQRRTSMLDPTGNQQDCLGMTPLHILTCSSVHDLEVYRVIIENYPTNLITKDRWGALPLLYAFWGAAPTEIIQFLLESYQSLYPDHAFYWTMMVDTLGRRDTPKERIENLLRVKQMHFPEQHIDWDHLLDEFASPQHVSFPTTFKEQMQFLVMCGMSSRVEALAFRVWRDSITNMIYTANFEYNGDNFHIIQGIRARVAHFEAEYYNLKEITTILELALWKLSMNENIPQEEVSHCQKKMKTNKSSMRRQCRITCGADVVIRHVLPYLITAAGEESDFYASSDDEGSDSM